MAPTALVSDPATGSLTKQSIVKKDTTIASTETPLQAICYGASLPGTLLPPQPFRTPCPSSTPTARPARDSCTNPLLPPGIPSHPTFAAHRLWALSHMTALFRHWARHNYNEGLSGHISLRDPEYPSLFWMNPLAVHFGLLRVSDMVLLSDEPDDDASPTFGRILAGNRRRRPANKAGWAIHSAVHRRRGDVRAACHAHTRYGKVWAAMGGRRLEMVDQDVCNFYGEALAVYGNYGGVVVGSALGEGEAIAEALGEKGKGMILANHGLLTVGGTVDEAGFLFGLLERSCAVQVELGKAGGGKRVIEDREAEFNFSVASTPESLYWEFQAEYDYEVAMSHDKFIDVTEEDLRLQI
ncbi:hypothetical protein MMC11_002218 [Xylographa trunciseda]|nr:hypothetical protein [Xylographa trunciseda]